MKTKYNYKLLLYIPGLVDGGAERVMAQLAGHLAARGHQVTLAVDFITQGLGPATPPDVKIYPLPAGHGRAVRALAALMRREKFDLAHAAIAGSNPKLALAKLLSGSQTPLIFGYHGYEEYKTGQLSWLSYRALPLLSRQAAKVVAVSDGLAAALAQNWGARPEKLTRIYNPVPIPAFQAADPTALAQRGPLIIAAGRLVALKGFDDLIRAFAGLKTPEARLAILGEGPERPHLQRLVARLDLRDRIALPGYQPDLSPWYGCARLLALSSHTESFGNVVAEALAAGLPVMATACGGPEEIMQAGAPQSAEYGRLVPVGDIPAMTTALSELLETPGDPAPRIARAAAFSADKGLAAYTRLFEQTVLENSQTVPKIPLPYRLKQFWAKTRLETRK